MAFTLISFFTVATPYEAEVERLRSSCRRFGIEAQILGIPSDGAWVHNCSRKARFICDRLDRLGTPVLWVDADAEIVRRPEIFESADFDVVCNMRHF